MFLPVFAVLLGTLCFLIPSDVVDVDDDSNDQIPDLDAFLKNCNAELDRLDKIISKM